MNQNIFQQLAAKHIQKFVDDLGDDLRQAVQSMWAGAGAAPKTKVAKPAKRAYTRKAKAGVEGWDPREATVTHRTKAPKTPKAPKATRAKGAGRPKAEVNQETLQAILTAINLMPEGAKGADIIEALKLDKATWTKTIKYAVAEGFVRTTGKTRKTLYFAGKRYAKTSNGAATHVEEPAAEAV